MWNGHFRLLAFDNQSIRRAQVGIISILLKWSCRRWGCLILNYCAVRSLWVTSFVYDVLLDSIPGIFTESSGSEYLLWNSRGSKPPVHLYTSNRLLWWQKLRASHRFSNQTIVCPIWTMLTYLIWTRPTQCFLSLLFLHLSSRSSRFWRSVLAVPWTLLDTRCCLLTCELFRETALTSAQWTR